MKLIIVLKYYINIIFYKEYIYEENVFNFENQFKNVNVVEADPVC